MQQEGLNREEIKQYERMVAAGAKSNECKKAFNLTKAANARWFKHFSKPASKVIKDVKPSTKKE